MRHPIKVKFVMATVTAFLTPCSHAEENPLPVDMSFLEYLGSMIEERGELVDITEVFAAEISAPEESENCQDTTHTPATCDSKSQGQIP
jgi:hypothetical protein